MTTPDLPALRRLAEEAMLSPPLDVCEEDRHRCPMCDGEGEVDGYTHSTRGEYAAGVQVFGIGADLEALDAFVRAFAPSVVLAILDRLAAAEAVVEAARNYALADEQEQMHLSCLIAAYDRAVADQPQKGTTT